MAGWRPPGPVLFLCGSMPRWFMQLGRWSLRLIRLPYAAGCSAGNLARGRSATRRRDSVRMQSGPRRGSLRTQRNRDRVLRIPMPV
jgi:hypothetical protein